MLKVAVFLLLAAIAVHCQKFPYQKNKLDCWYSCGNKGGSCPKFCGENGFCCRINWNDKGCTKAMQDVSPKHHTCVVGSPPVSYCAVSLKGGVKVTTKDLKVAQKALGRGSRSNQQAIIPMTQGKAGDPHKLQKSWGSGSMWWMGWNEIHQMRAKCELVQYVSTGSQWYCAVSLKGGVKTVSTDLKVAQKALGRGSRGNQQAIIPMTGRKAGDPHTLQKGWGSGSMWWMGWNEIHQVRAKCEISALASAGVKWYCAVSLKGGVKRISADLKVA